jgi:integrase
VGIYARQDSPYWWMLIEPTGAKSSTKILRDAPDAFSRKHQRQQAEAIYRAKMTDVARKVHGLPELEPETITFNAFADWYDTHHIAKHRGKEREREILPHLRAHFGRLDLTAITLDAVAEYETARLGAKKKPGTVNREVALLKQMLNAAVPKYLQVSPLKGRAMLRTVPIRKRVLTATEEARLLDELTPADRALYIVAVDTLARLSNVMNLSRAEDKGSHLELVDSKTGPYSVPLSKRARAALDALPKDGPYYFPQRRVAKTERDRRGAIRQLLQRACKRAGVPYGRAHGGITFHTGTRATGATRLLRAGVDPKTVQAIGNWASFDQMGDYLQTDMDRKRAAIQIAAAAITQELRAAKTKRKR